MRNIRQCDNAQLNTGGSKCEIPYDKLLGAIVVPYGSKLPASLTEDKLEELLHADVSERVYGIRTFVEAAKNGGEVQTSAVGYGPEQITGLSARKDTMTIDQYSIGLDAAISKAGNRKWGVYYFDCDGFLYGINDGTDVLAPFPMNNIYSDSTPFKTSSNAAQLTVTFSHENAKKSKEQADFIKLDFHPEALETFGLTEVMLVKAAADGSAYKIVEKVGGYDVTGIYGPLIASAGATVLNGSTSAATYNEADSTVTIATTGSAGVSLKAPKVLFENGIKGIVQVTA
ncbi:MAG: hypothetical protein NC187_08255 [Candidatus Amulumruptor caecigallinarius]|nr:hypothetical protein [Candidatus Amulumruptor caecigallinarius]MCM1397461.1 hypothetical protein [Candidatus Amulumruptor caecigallinarius]MCM1454332.1 hypothetical protein [bacterium]